MPNFFSSVCLVVLPILIELIEIEYYKSETRIFRNF